MNVIGYSERGIVNALFYEIARSPDPSGILQAFLDQATFPFAQSRPSRGDATVLIEQSFSDFGDCDALILVRHHETNACAIFVEAKVKTFRAEDWYIRDEFGEFRKGLNNKASSSNLFTQLYHKSRLVGGLRLGGVQHLRDGVEFPAWSSKARRRIGENGVVLDATKRLQSHLGEAFYLAVVPDAPDRVAAFFPELRMAPHSTLTNTWHVETYGYVTWSQVRAFCLDAGLARVVAIFDYNAGQLYRV